MAESPVRFLGSRELHRDLPKVLQSLERSETRCVLTVHSRPKAVLIGAEAFLQLLESASPNDRLLAMQLKALMQGHLSHDEPESTRESTEEQTDFDNESSSTEADREKSTRSIDRGRHASRLEPVGA